MATNSVRLPVGTQAANGCSHSSDASQFTMEGPMVALLMPFKADNQKIDDASFVKYLEVLSHIPYVLYAAQQLFVCEIQRPLHLLGSERKAFMCLLAALVARRHQECGGQWVSCNPWFFRRRRSDLLLLAFVTACSNLSQFCRSTGEFPSMTLAERKHAAELCRAHWPGKVVVGVSSTVVQDCVDLLEHASTQITTANKVS